MVIRGVMLKYKPVLSLPKGSMVGRPLRTTLRLSSVRHPACTVRPLLCNTPYRTNRALLKNIVHRKGMFKTVTSVTHYPSPVTDVTPQISL